jgi:hypothetical protein
MYPLPLPLFSSFPLFPSLPLSHFTHYSLLPCALLTLLPYKAFTRMALAGAHFRVQVLGFRRYSRYCRTRPSREWHWPAPIQNHRPLQPLEARRTRCLPSVNFYSTAPKSPPWEGRRASLPSTNFTQLP